LSWRVGLVVVPEDSGAQAGTRHDGRHLEHHVDQLQQAVIRGREVMRVDRQHDERHGLTENDAAAVDEAMLADPAHLKRRPDRGRAFSRRIALYVVRSGRRQAYAISHWSDPLPKRQPRSIPTGRWERSSSPASARAALASPSREDQLWGSGACGVGATADGPSGMGPALDFWEPLFLTHGGKLLLTQALPLPLRAHPILNLAAIREAWRERIGAAAVRA